MVFGKVPGKNKMKHTSRNHISRTPRRCGNEQVEQLLLTGLSRKEIAQKLDLPEHTVGYHSKRLYRLNGVQDRIQLMAKFIENLRRESCSNEEAI
jgi:DNA-binding NarL/FixJ family response regulator